MKKEKIIYWVTLVLRILFGLLFLSAGLAKIFGVEATVQEFDVVGLGQWFRYFVGLWEVIGAVLILWPAKRQYGAILLTLACGGAFLAQVFALHADWVHTVVLGLILFALVYQDRKRLLK